MTKEQIEKELGKKMVFTKHFKHHGQSESEENDGSTFSAYHDALNWLRQYGIDSGSMERSRPIGLCRNADIAKWTNLIGQGWNDRLDLDGAMISESFRNSDVVVYLSFNPENEGK